jgi:hypothetical protein
MPNSPASDFRAEKRSKTRNPIVPQSSAVAQDQQEARSPHPHQISEQERSLAPHITYPSLPPARDKLINLPWHKQASLEVDLWLEYVNLEFGGVA